jgi:hypothetical protein
LVPSGGLTNGTVYSVSSSARHRDRPGYRHQGDPVFHRVRHTSRLIDHVTTQIPYALVCATSSLAGFIVLVFTRSSTVGLLTALPTLAVFVLRSSFARETQRRSEVGRTAG